MSQLILLCAQFTFHFTTRPNFLPYTKNFFLRPEGADELCGLRCDNTTGTPIRSFGRTVQSSASRSLAAIHGHLLHGIAQAWCSGTPVVSSAGGPPLPCSRQQSRARRTADLCSRTRGSPTICPNRGPAERERERVSGARAGRSLLVTRAKASEHIKGAGLENNFICQLKM